MQVFSIRSRNTATFFLLLVLVSVNQISAATVSTQSLERMHLYQLRKFLPSKSNTSICSNLYRYRKKYSQCQCKYIPPSSFLFPSSSSSPFCPFSHPFSSYINTHMKMHTQSQRWITIPSSSSLSVSAKYRKPKRGKINIEGKESAFQKKSNDKLSENSMIESSAQSDRKVTTKMNVNINSDRKEEEEEEEEKQRIRSQTVRWISEHVISLNLCPWARASMNSHQADIQVYLGKDTTELTNLLLGVGLHLQDKQVAKKCSKGKNKIVEEGNEQLENYKDFNPQLDDDEKDIGNYIQKGYYQEDSTVLVVTPNLFMEDQNGFLDYLDYIGKINAIFERTPNLSTQVQIASFHPSYLFAESPNETDVENYTNRSPYPIFHFLRENEVSKAIGRYGEEETALIYSRNRETMKKLGREYLEEKLWELTKKEKK